MHNTLLITYIWPTVFECNLYLVVTGWYSLASKDIVKVRKKYPCYLISILCQYLSLIKVHLQYIYWCRGIFFTERYECNISQLNSLNDVIHKLDNSVNLVFSKCMFISIHILSWYEYWTDNKITFAKANTFSMSGCHRKLSYCKHLFICPVHKF